MTHCPIDDRQRRRRADEVLELTGLVGMASRRPHELSGGQRQRVALARALAVDPDVLMLDEPLGALDLKLRQQMQKELKPIQRQVGTTFVHVTHDQEEAMAMADRIALMNAGRIVDAGTPESIYLRPASLFSAGFMGEINRMPATPDGDTLSTPLGPVTLRESTFFGNCYRCHFTAKAASDLTLIADLSPGAVPDVDDVVMLYGSHPLLLEAFHS